MVEIHLIQDRYRSSARQQRGHLVVRPVAHPHRDQHCFVVERQLGPAVKVRTPADAHDETQQAAHGAAPQHAARSCEKEPADTDRAECKEGEPEAAEHSDPPSNRSTNRGAFEGVLARLLANSIAFTRGHRGPDVR